MRELRFLSKANSLRRALWSWIRKGTVDAQTYSMRKTECYRCPERIQTPKASYCRACGCPQWWLSRIEIKARMFELKCPLDKW